MSKGRRTNKGTKEYSDLQRIKYDFDKLEKELHRMEHELEKSNRENARLRKQLARADTYLFDMSNASALNRTKAEEREYQKSVKDALKKKWLCHECGEGHLFIHEIKLLDGIKKYYRLCSKEGCGNRTKMKTLTPEVEGLRSDDES